MQDSDYEINQGDLDALDALASQLSSQMDLFSFDPVHNAQTKPVEDEEEKVYPPPPAPLLPNLKWDSLWLPPTPTHKTRTLPRPQAPVLPNKTTIPPHINIPPVPVRSSSVPRPRPKKPTLNPAASPAPSEDSGM